ncbi:hypothetical protein, partial [Pseudomonas aeruginosa]
LDKPVIDKIKAWVNDGGTLITFQSASAWAIQQDIVKEKVAPAAFTGRNGGDTPTPTTTNPETNKAIAGE